MLRKQRNERTAGGENREEPGVPADQEKQHAGFKGAVVEPTILIPVERGLPFHDPVGTEQGHTALVEYFIVSLLLLAAIGGELPELADHTVIAGHRKGGDPVFIDHI